MTSKARTTPDPEPDKPEIEMDAPVVAARLARGLRWSVLVAEMERDRRRSPRQVAEGDREVA